MTWNAFLDAAGFVSGAGPVAGGRLYCYGRVLWVASDGDNGNDGLDYYRPKATLASALTASAEGDIICFKAGYTGSISGVTSIPHDLTICGEVDEDGEPTCRLTFTSNGTFTVAGRVEIRGMRFRGTSTAPWFTLHAAPTVSNGSRFIDCRFEVSGTTTSSAACIHADGSVTSSLTIRGCEFSQTVQGSTFLRVAAMAANFVLEETTFDSGGLGHSYAANTTAEAVYLQSATVFPGLEHMHVTDVRLLGGAIMRVASASKGQIHIAEATGGGRVEWV